MWAKASEDDWTPKQVPSHNLILFLLIFVVLPFLLSIVAFFPPFVFVLIIIHYHFSPINFFVCIVGVFPSYGLFRYSFFISLLLSMFFFLLFVLKEHLLKYHLVFFSKPHTTFAPSFSLFTSHFEKNTQKNTRTIQLPYSSRVSWNRYTC